MKKIIPILMFILFIIGCSTETVKHLIFSEEELNQITIEDNAGMKSFSVPNKDWKIEAYLPSYSIINHDFTIFQASRHYNGEHLITVITSIIDPESGVYDLNSCLDYKKKFVVNYQDFSV